MPFLQKAASYYGVMVASGGSRLLMRGMLTRGRVFVRCTMLVIRDQSVHLKSGMEYCRNPCSDQNKS